MLMLNFISGVLELRMMRLLLQCFTQLIFCRVTHYLMEQLHALLQNWLRQSNATLFHNKSCHLDFPQETCTHTVLCTLSVESEVVGLAAHVSCIMHSIWDLGKFEIALKHGVDVDVTDAWENWTKLSYCWLWWAMCQSSQMPFLPRVLVASLIQVTYHNPFWMICTFSNAHPQTGVY